MQVNVGEAKTQLSKLLARAEAGELVEIARDGVPVVRLVPIDPAELRPGQRFLAAAGSMAGEIWFADDYDDADQQILEMFDPDFGAVEPRSS